MFFNGRHSTQHQLLASTHFPHLFSSLDTSIQSISVCPSPPFVILGSLSERTQTVPSATAKAPAITCTSQVVLRASWESENHSMVLVCTNTSSCRKRTSALTYALLAAALPSPPVQLVQLSVPTLRWPECIQVCYYEGWSTDLVPIEWCCQGHISERSLLSVCSCLLLVSSHPLCWC